MHLCMNNYLIKILAVLKRLFPIYFILFVSNVWARDITHAMQVQLLGILKTGSHVSISTALPLKAAYHTDLGHFYESNALLDSAVSNYKQAITLDKKSANEIELAGVSMNLGRVLEREEGAAIALRYFQPALKTYLRYGLTDSAASAYVHIASSNVQLGNYHIAENLLLSKALPMFSRSGNNAGKLNTFRILGKTYFNAHKFSQSKWFFIQENILARKINDKSSVVRSLISLGHVKIAIRDYALAINDFKSAQRLLGSDDVSEEMILVLSGLTDVYKRIGDLSTAKTYSSSYKKVKRLALKANEDHQKEILAMVSSYRRSLASNPANEVIGKPNIVNRKTRPYLLTSLLALFAVVTTTGIILYRRRYNLMSR